MSRRRAVSMLSALSWLVCGCAEDSPAEALQRKCKVFNSCFEEQGLLGRWDCDLGEGTRIEIRDDGRWSQENGIGQVGAGCITCDGDYEVVNTEDSESRYPRFAAFGTFRVDGDGATWRNQHCLHSNLKECRSDPSASGNASCTRVAE